MWHFLLCSHTEVADASYDYEPWLGNDNVALDDVDAAAVLVKKKNPRVAWKAFVCLCLVHPVVPHTRLIFGSCSAQLLLTQDANQAHEKDVSYGHPSRTISPPVQQREQWALQKHGDEVGMPGPCMYIYNRSTQHAAHITQHTADTKHNHQSMHSAAQNGSLVSWSHESFAANQSIGRHLMTAVTGSMGAVLPINWQYWRLWELRPVPCTVLNRLMSSHLDTSRHFIISGQGHLWQQPLHNLMITCWPYSLN